MIQGDQTGTLSTVNNQAVCYEPASAMEENWRESDVKNALRAEQSTSNHAVVYPEVSRTLSARHDSSPCIDRGQEFVRYSSGFCPQMGSKAYGIGYAEEQSPTLRTTNDSAVCYGICSDKSNSMLSDNPHSGIYEADTSRTLDNNCGNPACNQGGIAIVEQETASGVICLNPHDSQSARVYDANGVWHSLNANSGGGQSRDAVCYVKTTKPHSKDEAPTIEQSDISPTLNQFDSGDTRSNTFVIERGETE